MLGEMERELLEEGGTDPLEGGRERDKSPPKPSKSKLASPVGVSGAGVEQEPKRIAAFSSSRFLRHAAFGFK